MRNGIRAWLVVLLAVSAQRASFGESEKPVDCPKCKGTGIAVEMDCPSCIRSGKPGYNNMGDHLEMCQRCKGKGRIVGAFCTWCNRGKIYLSQFKPCDGGTKNPPPGWKWCPKCLGSAVESWMPCNQCKRSKWPGYTQMGEGLAPCNRCNGKAQLPAMACAECQGKGVVLDTTVKDHTGGSGKKEDAGK